MKRQETDEEELERQLCEGKGAGEWFRLETGNDKCRDVIQCTASVRNTDRNRVRKGWLERARGLTRDHATYLKDSHSSRSVKAGVQRFQHESWLTREVGRYR